MADNPFSNLNLPPRAAAQTGIFSVIDRLNNVPTQDQIMMGDKERIRQDDLGRSAGEREALSAIMQKVGEVRANNPDADPQSLITQVIRDPVFVQSAMKISADKMQSVISEAFKTTTPTRPEMKVLPQGATYGTTDPTTGAFSPQGTTPNAKEAEYQFLLNRTPEERAQLAEATRALTRAGRSPSENEEAIGRLIATGKLTREQGDKILAGTLKVTPILGPDGKPEDYVVIDLTDPNGATARKFNAPAQPEIVQPQRGGQLQPGQQTAPVDANEPPEKRADLLKNKADMFDASGPVGWATGQAGRAAGNVPGMEGAGEETNMQRDALSRYSFAATQAFKEGKTFKSEMNQIEHLLPEAGLANTNPLTEINKAIGLQDFMTATQNAERGIEADTRMPRRRRIEAAEKIRTIDSVLRTLPTREEMLAKREAIRTGRAGTTINDLSKTVPSKEQFQRGLNESAQPKGRDPTPANPQTIERPDGKPNPYDGLPASSLVELFSKRHTLSPQQQKDLLDVLKRNQKMYTPQR
jgi:hypothetical protein